MTDTNPMIYYYVDYLFTNVESVGLIKETTMGYFLKYSGLGSEGTFVRKDMIKLFPTFEAARSYLVSAIEAKQQSLAKDLAKALELTPTSSTRPL